MPRSTDSLIRSYTNLLIVNGLVLVPLYPTVDPRMDRRVVNLLTELMPTHEVQGPGLLGNRRKGWQHPLHVHEYCLPGHQPPWKSGVRSGTYARGRRYPLRVPPSRKAKAACRQDYESILSGKMAGSRERRH